MSDNFRQWIFTMIFAIVLTINEYTIEKCDTYRGLYIPAA